MMQGRLRRVGICFSRSHAGAWERETKMPSLEAGASFPIWTPFDAFEVATKLFEELQLTPIIAP